MKTLITHRPNLFAALLLLAIATALFLPYLLQPNHLMWPRSELGTDMLTYNWPSIYFFREALRNYGEMPLWMGSAAGGLPLIGNPAVRTFYPPQLLATVLPIPILWGYAVLNVFHFWLAGMGGYWLGRSVLNVSFAPALLAGLIVMLTPRLSSNVVGDVGYTYGLCWMPLFLLWMRLAFDRRSWRWGLATGMALCCIYLTNIQFILYAGWLVGLYFAYHLFGLIRNKRPLREWVQAAGILMVIMAAMMGLAAYQVLPFISYLPYQSRQAMTLEGANYLALPPIGLMNTLFPISQKFPEWEIYAGLLPLLLAPLAILHPARREKIWWAGLLIFAVMFSLGSVTPLYTVMVKVVPGFGLLRVPARMWYVAALALAMLTALAVEGVIARKSLPAKGWRWLVAGGSLFILVTIAGRFVTQRPDELDWTLGLLTAIGTAVGLIVLWLWQQGKVHCGLLTATLGAAIVLDLFPLDVAFARPRPIDDFTQAPPIVAKMIEVAPDEPYRVYSTRREIGDPVSVVHNLQTADGLISFQFGNYVQFMRAASGCELVGLAAAIPACASNEISETGYLGAQPNLMLLGLLNVRYVISTLDLQNDTLTLVAADGDEKLYENNAVFPRAFAVGRAEVVDASDLETRLPKLKDGSVALVEASQTPGITLPDHDFFQTATIVSYTPNRIALNIAMSDSGILVLGEPWTPGWAVMVDGHPSEVLRVDGALRGVLLEAGQHDVQFLFNPPALAIGLVVTAISVVIGAVAAISGWRRRPKHQV